MQRDRNEPPSTLVLLIDDHEGQLYHIRASNCPETYREQAVVIG